MQGRTIFITGGSRGIGEAIAVAAGAKGANVAIAAKTSDPHPKLPGTIHTAAAAVEAAGGKALPLQVDIRDEDAVAAAMARTAEEFGGIDVVVNNASAIRLEGTDTLAVKRYDLLHSINGRGTFVTVKAALPYLKESDNPHILTLSPPLDLDRKWFEHFGPYIITKFTMSLFTHAWAGELFRDFGIGAYALWPRTTIATAAVEHEISSEMMKLSRTPAIMADAAVSLLERPAADVNGGFYLDDEVVLAAGIRDLSVYDVTPGSPHVTDFMVESLPGMLGADPSTW